MTRVVALFAVSALLLIPARAEAHLELTSHLARYGSQQKAGPCGVAGGERTTDRVYIAKPGTEVMLVWDETVDHNPSHYRIDFDPDGDDSFGPTHVDPPCADRSDAAACFDFTNSTPYMVNDIADSPDVTQSYLYTLPDMECDNCTLQVIQVMHDKPPFETSPTDNDIYYQCIDIILSNDGPDELTLIEVEGEPDAGTIGGGGDAGMGGGDGMPSTSGGCQASGAGTGSAGGALLFAALLLARRRARRGRS